ncbi:MAG: YcaO-like family protein [Gemmataceae bacterium]|nr:YcaO-like family protein [Gemmataceae bacterium]
MGDWVESRFTGLGMDGGPVPRRAFDPAVALHAALGPEGRTGSGAGWDRDSARDACHGELIERALCRPLPRDFSILSSHREWPLDEPAVEPSRWVLFHPEQYALPGFPYEPFTEDAVVRWTCCRDAGTGQPWWVPEELVHLEARPGERHRLGRSASTGLSCGRGPVPVLLRGLQEVIERDALTGAWWGRYPLEEWPEDEVFGLLDPSIPPRLRRPNLRWRFYRARSPFSQHVALARCDGEDGEGWAVRFGSACRETLAASWAKALLEAAQCIPYVRHLRRERGGERGPPADFAAHALHYTLHPEQMACTVAEDPAPRVPLVASPEETLEVLRERLGRPVLFRDLTPPGISSEVPGWRVLRVVVPGLQPLHGDHRFPHLGGPLWAPRGWSDWLDSPPHPFA